MANLKNKPAQEAVITEIKRTVKKHRRGTLGMAHPDFQREYARGSIDALVNVLHRITPASSKGKVFRQLSKIARKESRGRSVPGVLHENLLFQKNWAR